MQRQLLLLAAAAMNKSVNAAARTGIALSATCVRVSSTQAGELLLEPERLTSASQLAQSELESLAFILGTKEEVYQSFARQGHSAFSDVLMGLNTSQKRLLVQKLVAASGVRSTPLLLAWTAEELRHALRSVVSAAADANTLSSLQAQPWYPDILQLAQSWASQEQQKQQQQHEPPAPLDERQCTLNMLAVPGAMRWPALLALPELDALLRHLLLHEPSKHARQQPLLAGILTHLGLLSDPPLPPVAPAAAAAQAPTLAAAAAVLHRDARQYLHAALSARQGTGQGAGQGGAPPVDLERRALGAAAAASLTPPVDLSVPLLVLALLRHVRCALGLAGLPPGATVALRLLRCGPAAAAATGLPATTALIGNAEAVQAAAAELHAFCFRHGGGGGSRSLAPATGVGVGGVGVSLSEVWGELQGGSPEALWQVQALLRRAAATKPGGALERLFQAIQADRKAQLLQGQPWALATASLADLEQLTPAEFDSLSALARAQLLAGSQLRRQLRLLPADAPPGAVAPPAGLLQLAWALPDGDRAALAWVLLASGWGGAAPERALLALLEAHTGRLADEASSSAQAAEELAAMARLERHVAALDWVAARDAPPPMRMSSPGLAAPRAPAVELPPREQMAAARAALPESHLLLFDLLRDELSGMRVPDSAQLVHAFDALIQGLPGGSLPPPSQTGQDPHQLLEAASGQQPPPPALAQWLHDSKRQLAALPPAALAALAQFCELRVLRGGAGAVQARERLGVLAAELARLLAMATAAPGTGTAQAAAGAGAALSPYWAAPDVSQLQPPSSPDAPSKQPSPELVAEVLGPAEAAQFEAWLRASALSGADARREARAAPAVGLDDQPYQMLGDVHREQDMQRYLAMEHDPQLHMVVDEAPRPWREAGPVHTPQQWLEATRPHLDRYLAALGMRPLLDAEWPMYRSAALGELEASRGAHEAALRSQGHSAFFNSRAEATYLRGLLRAGIPAGAPLEVQAHRYLTVLEGNTSWTFVQRKRVVQRLIELSAHFAKHPPPSERGSPFAPLFAPGGAELLVPKVAPWHELRTAERRERIPELVAE